MSLPAFSVSRPVLSIMVTLIVVVIGLFSLSKLQIDLLPSIEFPTASVRIGYDGASPEVMEQSVTRILEEIIATVPGVVEITSESSQGDSDIRVAFDWGVDINVAALDLQAIIEDEINELPDEVDRPRVGKWDINSFPIVILGIASELDPIELTDLVNNQVRNRLSRVPGVAQVDLFGSYDREIRVEVDAGRVKALGLPLDRVLNALRDANVDLPAGVIEEGIYEIRLRAPAQFTTVEEIRETVVETRDGAAIRLRDLAEVLDTHQRETRIARVNGDEGLRLGIRKQSAANTVEVSAGILEAIKHLQENYPQIQIIATSNQGNFIERSIANVARSVLYGGFLAILILLFFLRNLRSTLVISLAIPISIMATFALMYLGGFTLNLMTLGGLALGVGMMVDSSIVVLENIFRRRDELGEAPKEAAPRGAMEVTSAIVASTLTTLVIFLPLIFLKGVPGILFGELALVIVFSLICALLVAISLVPVLASKLLETPEKRAEQPADSFFSKLAQRSERGVRAIDGGYQKVLKAGLRRPWLVVGLSALAVGVSLLFLPQIGREFMPPSDEGQVRISAEMDTATRLEIVEEAGRILEAQALESVPEVDSWVSRASIGQYNLSLSLVPVAERSRSNVEIADQLRRELIGLIPGMELRVRAPQGQFILERILNSDANIDVEVRGFDLDTLHLLGEQVVAAAESVPGITDVRFSVQDGTPQQEIQLDRNKVADLGLSVREVSGLVQTAISGSQAGQFFSDGNGYRIFVQLKDAERLSIQDVLDLTLTTPGGEPVALRNLVRTEASRGPLEINRKNQQRLVEISINIAERDLGSVAGDLQAQLDTIARPDGYELVVAGAFEEQQKASRELLISMLLALALVYMVLASQYESLRDPLVVMLSAPVAAVGVIFTLLLTGTTLNLQSYIGCIMLAGIVVNNAILLVDQTGRIRQETGDLRGSIIEAGRRRLRPILMTTLTTILGLMPLALGIGEGADAQAPLARAVVGGLAGSTLITLILIPVVYSLFHGGLKGRTALDNRE